MFRRPWTARLFGHLLGASCSLEQRRTLRPPAAVNRLRLETLEDRLAPATLTVNSTADTANPTDPYLSLREAIAIVNSPSLPDGLSGQILGQISGDLHGGGADTIGFDTSVVTTPISLAGGQLELSLPAVTAAVTIDGSGVVAVDGANATRVFQVDPGVQATFAHLGIVRGYAAGPGEASLGGGVYNRGVLTLTDCNLDGNTTAGGVGGGLCNNGGTAMVDGSAVTNSAAVDGNGGGLYNSADGTLTVTDSLVRGNSAYGYGGGIYNQGGMLTVTGSTLADNSLDRIAATLGGGIYNTRSGTTVVDGSVLSGNSALYGGGIEADSGTLTLSDSAVRSNYAYNGGGIETRSGTLTVTGSAVSSNSANFQGGGIHILGSTTTVTESAIYSNSGFGISIQSGTLTVTNSTLTANSSSAIYNDGGVFNPGTLTVTNCTFSSNTSVGIYNGGRSGLFTDGVLTVTNCTFRSNTSIGVSNLGTATVTNCTFTANVSHFHFYGVPNPGGIFNEGTLTVTNSTLSSNSTDDEGGSIANVAGGTLTVTGCTLSGNSAGAYGAGIYNSGTLTVINSTLSGNSAGQGGGIYNTPTGTVALRNTIVAGNTSSSGAPDIYGSVQSNSSYNLVGIADGTLSGISDGMNHNQVGTPASPIDPGLLPLGDYGGPTYTMALLPGSPALDAGDPAQAGTPDQRGVTRTGGINIGAFQASAVILLIYAPATVTAGVPFDVRVAAFDPFGLSDFGYTGTVTLSISDPQVGLIGTHTFTLADAGSFTFSATAVSPGVQTLTARDGTLTATADLTVVPGAAPFERSGPPGPPRVVESSVAMVAYDMLDSLGSGFLGAVLADRSDGLGLIR